MLAMFMAAVEATIVATAMPTIIADLGGFQLFSWVFAIYLLTQAVTTPIYGKLADMFGRKPAFYGGACLFLIGSAMAGLATSMEWLIAFRALQGLGAGAIMPVATTIIGDIYTAEERAAVQGYLSAVWGVAAVIGPALGAFFVEHWNWALVFWVNLPIGVITIALMALFLHEGERHRAHQVDYPGAALLTTGTTALMLGLIQGASLPSGLVAALIIGSALALVSFLHVERRALEPMMPLGLWRSRVIATGNLAQLVAAAVMIGTTSFLPSFVQGVMGKSASAAGIVVGAMAFAWPIASSIGGPLMVATSFRLTALLGAISLTFGSAVLAVMGPDSSLYFACFGAVFVGFGLGFTNSTYLIAVQTSVDWPQRGAATSANIFMRMIGQSMGAALYGALVNHGVARDAGANADIVNQMMEPASRSALAPELLDRVTLAMAAALHSVFVIAALLATTAIVLALRVPAHLNPTNAYKVLRAS
jgi:EmrB/QacA subfamily drug resistance transporter